MSNQTKESLASLLNSLSEDEKTQLIENVPALWVIQHNIKNETGVPIDFTNYPFQIDMYNDLSPLQVTLKPPQIGETLKNIIKSLFVAKKIKKDIIYTLPTQTDIYDMAGGKVNRVIAQNPILKSWVKDHDTVEQKSVGDNIIYYRGTFTSKAAMMVSSGLNIHDEVDASDLSVITQYETRLQAQEDGGWRWYFSHPSLAGMGVDTYWQKSDKKEWVITCPACKQDQVLTWPKSVSREKNAYVCKSCDEVLPNEARINGYWYATSQGEFSGYHVSQLMLYNKSAKDILDAYDDPLKDKQYFYNYVLGLPYQGGDDQITTEQVLKNCTDTVNSQEGKIIIGVDPGLPVHYVCMNEEGLFYFNKCSAPSETDDGYEDIRRLMRRWPQAIVITDQGGDLNPMRKMQFEFPGRVFLAFYRRPTKTDALWKWGEKNEYGTVTIDRNRTIQMMIGELKEGGRFKLNGTPKEFIEYAEHFANMYREKVVVKEAKDKDDKTLYGAEYVWKRRGPDHWAHCTLYARVGLDKYGKSMAKVGGQNILSTMRTGQIVSDEGVVLLRGNDSNVVF